VTAPECLHCGRANLSRIVPCVSAKHRPEYGSVMGICYSLGSRELRKPGKLAGHFLGGVQ
jgi:hypothetical protein